MSPGKKDATSERAVIARRPSGGARAAEHLPAPASERLVRAVEAIYAAAAMPSTWSEALQAIADCFDDVGAILIYGRDDGGFGVIESPLLKATVEEYMREWSHRDIRAIRARERGYFIPSDVTTDRDVLSEVEMETEPFYADFLARHGLKYFAAAGVSPDPHVAVAISVQRRRGKPEYTEEEIAVLRRLAPHIERSLRLSIRLMDTELVNAGLGAALTRIGIGVFVLDSLGRIVFSNPAGQELLGDGIDVVNERLLVAPSSERAAAEAAIGRIISGEPGDLVADVKPILIHRRRASRPLALYVLPIAAAASAAQQFLTHARAIVLLIDPEVGGPPDPSLVRDVLSLTLGEARIASLIGSGVPPREAAEKLGIAEETARTVLKRVFAKVGVSRQSELAALMTKLVLR